MATLITLLYGNVGRTDRGNSTRVDTDALEALHAKAPDERGVVLLNEIREGDDNNEMRLARDIFRGWTWYCTGTREPIGLSPDWPKMRSRVLWVRDSSVPHWSPRRSINMVHLPGTTLLGGHYAAGAYHGDRPAAARQELRTSWDNMLDVHRRIERRLHTIGRNVTWAMDTNHVTMPTVVPGERTVVHARTDWIRALPAKGQRVKVTALPPVDFHIDSHNGQRARLAFQDAA